MVTPSTMLASVTKETSAFVVCGLILCLMNSGVKRRRMVSITFMNMIVSRSVVNRGAMKVCWVGMFGSAIRLVVLGVCLGVFSGRRFIWLGRDWTRNSFGSIMNVSMIVVSA